MFSQNRRNKGAFTLVEIMIVVAIIGLLAALAVPGFVRARKTSQARRIINDTRQIDAAIDQWALETGQTDSSAISTSAISAYMKRGYPGNDLLGNPWDLSGGVGTNQKPDAHADDACCGACRPGRWREGVDILRCHAGGSGRIEAELNLHVLDA